MTDKPEETNKKEPTGGEEIFSQKKSKKIEALQEEIKKLKSDVDHWKNEYYRAYADTQNLRNNLQKDHREAMKYRSEGFIDNLLPVLDSFHSVLAKEPDDEKLKNYLVGFNYIYRNLVTILENEGVKEFAPKEGDKFDAFTMNAVDTLESDGPENLVCKVYGNGYKLHDRMVRPAMVQVSSKKKNSAEAQNKKEDA